MDNPEPSPGQYDFRSLDRRTDFIRRSGGIPVIVLCRAPDWIKGGQPWETDWDRLEDAPHREHFADFAALCATVGKRYPYVRHFLVLNEFEGQFDDELNRWDAKGYTDLYNVVYDAVKAVDPANQVGGPYLSFESKPLGSPDSSSPSGQWLARRFRRRHQPGWSADRRLGTPVSTRQNLSNGQRSIYAVADDYGTITIATTPR